jgi:signal transduction histidine kinase
VDGGTVGLDAILSTGVGFDSGPHRGRVTRQGLGAGLFLCGSQAAAARLETTNSTSARFLERGPFMAIPVLRRREAGEVTTGDAASDHSLREVGPQMHDLLAQFGHELRTPLAAICNALQVLALDGEGAATRDCVRGLMERQTQCIGRLVEDMMEVSRTEHGKIHLLKEPVDLAECVARAVETVRSSLDERGHQLEVTLPPGPVSVNADPGRLEQVLKNLLNNAAKYTEPGGRIWLTAEARGSDVVLRIRDTGIGIYRKMLPQVFESFWQVELALDHSQGGLGIGPALDRKVVEIHGGSVSASTPGAGRGREFVVRLPLASTSRGQDPSATAEGCPVESFSHRIAGARRKVRHGRAPDPIRNGGFQNPGEVQSRKPMLGSPLFQPMNHNTSGHPCCDLDSQQKLGPRARSRVHDGGK